MSLNPRTHRAALRCLAGVAILGGAWNVSERHDAGRERNELEQEVLDVVRRWNGAFVANDADAYFAFVDPDVTVMTPGNPYRVEGAAQDREEFTYGLVTGRTRVNQFQMMQPKVQVCGDAAVVTYYWRGSLGPDPKLVASFKETDVFVRRPEGWKLLHVHLSQ